MSRLLAFDLDGTLLDEAKQVPAATQAALAQLRAQRYLFAVITGRDALPEVVEALSPDAWAVSNGGCVFVDGQPQGEMHFDRQDLLAVLALATPGAEVFAYGRRGVYMDFPADKELPDWLQGREVLPLSQAAADDIRKVGLYHLQVAEWAEALRGTHPHLTLTGAQDPYPDFLTVTPQGADKGAALVALAQALRVPLAATVAFGDSDNDLAMLELAGVAVQVGQLPLLAPHADHQLENAEAVGGWLLEQAAAWEQDQFTSQV